MKFIITFFATISLLIAQNKSILIDDFESISDWIIVASEGTELKLSSDEGKSGKCLKIDYSFKYGTGYCGIQKKLKFKVPHKFRFQFYIKAISPNNNFEIKFLDSSKENVWWYNNRGFEFPKEWEKFFVRKRNVQFAWGPIEDKTFKEFDFIEFIIASFNGGSGTIFLDELVFEELLDSSDFNPKIFPSNLDVLIDDKSNTFFSTTKNELSFLIDLNKVFEISGLKIEWDSKKLKDIEIFESPDSITWNKILDVKRIFKSKSYFLFKELETRFLKFKIKSEKGIKISEIKIFDYTFSQSKNNIFFDLAESSFSKLLPRYFKKEASYWTVVGTAGDEKEALIDSDGMIEVDKNNFSFLPFIKLKNKLLSYHDFNKTQKLENNYLPFPIVEWDSPELKLIVQTFSWGIPNKTTKLFVEYKLINKKDQPVKGNLFLTILPFQVNPYYQFLNNPGGTSKIESILKKENFILINNNKLLIDPQKSEIIIFDFDRNDAISAIAEENYLGNQFAKNCDNLNSAIIKYNFDLSKKDTFNVRAIYYYYSTEIQSSLIENFNYYFENEKNKALNFWISLLNNTTFSGGYKVKELFDIVRTNLAYILINKDYSGIQPGSRSYERSWIRDGSLTSTALLRFGFNYDVKSFIKWYSGYIYENGKVPCVVDHRGPDPVDEHDSHGQFIYLLKTYFNYTKDTALLRKYFPIVKKIVLHIDSLTRLRKTEKYKSNELSAFYGLMPESISHEGYSAKPMHSFWDDFFTICGLNEATQIAFVLNQMDDYQYFMRIRDEFQNNLLNSIKRTIKNHKIDYIPGCVELGDYDPTSTSIAFFPTNQAELLPEFELKNTFEKYYNFIINRIKKNDFINFTPYEIRNINSFLFLGQKKRALELLDFMLNYQRPRGWNHWAEVVWEDSTKPEFIGDMPHTWVGSEFINAFRNMFVYENETDSTLKLLLGFDEIFLDDNNSFEIKNLITQLGNLNLSIKKDLMSNYLISINGTLKLEGWRIELTNFTNKILTSAYINENEIIIDNQNRIFVSQIPAKIKLIVKPYHE